MSYSPNNEAPQPLYPNEAPQYLTPSEYPSDLIHDDRPISAQKLEQEKQEKQASEAFYRPRDPAIKRQICGLRKSAFVLSLIFLFLVIVAAAVGGGVGGALAAKSNNNRNSNE